MRASGVAPAAALPAGRVRGGGGTRKTCDGTGGAAAAAAAPSPTPSSACAKAATARPLPCGAVAAMALAGSTQSRCRPGCARRESTPSVPQPRSRAAVNSRATASVASGASGAETSDDVQGSSSTTGPTVRPLSSS